MAPGSRVNFLSLRSLRTALPENDRQLNQTAVFVEPKISILKFLST